VATVAWLPKVAELQTDQTIGGMRSVRLPAPECMAQSAN